nr:hypothetical protein BaRGS_019079 [Batillaria attramentaria]KAG5714093.1 hypothetical protein BaRGS_020421 [Batillaria attramentaria]
MATDCENDIVCRACHQSGHRARDGVCSPLSEGDTETNPETETETETETHVPPAPTPVAPVMVTTDREPNSDVTSLTSSDTSERHVADQRLQRGRELLERGRQGKKNEKQTTLAGFLPRRHRSETPSKRLRSDSQSPPMPHEKTARTFAAEKSLNSGQASSSTAEGSGT